MLRILRPAHADPALNRKLAIVRWLFLMIGIALAVLYWRYGLREGMPDMVSSSSRRQGGADATWEASPVEFIIRFLTGGVFSIAIGVVIVAALTESIVKHRHGSRPPKRRRYPH